MTREDGEGFRWVLPAFTAVLLAFALTVLATNILPARRNLRAMEAVEQKIDRDIRRLTEMERDLGLKARALTSDPMTQEAEFRRTFRTGRPGETVYQFEEDAAIPGPSPAGR